MVMSKLVSRRLLHLHILFQPLVRRVCFVALVTIKPIKLQILHSHSKIEISENMIILSTFSEFSAFSAGSVSSTDSVVVSSIFTASSEVSPIYTATLAAAHLSFLLSLQAPALLLGPW